MTGRAYSRFDRMLIDAQNALGTVFGAAAAERPNPACPVGRNIQSLLEARFESATRALEAELDRITIADAAAEVEGREDARHTG